MNISSFSDAFKKIASIIVSSFLLLNCSNAISKNTISGDGILSIPQTNSIKAKALIWRYNGTLLYLDAALKPITTTKLNVGSISSVVQYDKGLLVIGEAKSENDTITNLVLNIDSKGDVQNTWASDAFLFWSVAYDKGKYLATTDTGELLQLKPDNTYSTIDKYPETSIYISVPKQDNIICISPNLTKLHYASAKCLRKGANKWEADGKWRNILRPFQCGNYLVEPTGNWRGAKVRQLLVRDIQSGNKVTQKSLDSLETASCIDDKVLYIAKNIKIAKIPTLETLTTSSCGSPHPRSATLVDGAIVCLDKNGRLHADLN